MFLFWVLFYIHVISVLESFQKKSLLHGSSKLAGKKKARLENKKNLEIIKVEII